MIRILTQTLIPTHTSAALMPFLPLVAVALALGVSYDQQALAQVASEIEDRVSSSRRVIMPGPLALLQTKVSNSTQADEIKLDIDAAETSESIPTPRSKERDDDEIDFKDDEAADRSRDEKTKEDEDSKDDGEEDRADRDEESNSEKANPLLDMKTIRTDTRSLRINIAETSPDSPADQSSDLVEQGLGNASILPSEKIFAWAAPDIRYQPLYFEDVTLERYGQTPCGSDLRQRVLSAAHFYQSAAVLPLLMLDQHPQSCDWPLGFCRPGTESPFVWQKRIVHDY